MEELKKFFADNAAQIWTLISVIVGGVVTYISTSATERRKNKCQAQKENLEHVLIPYCTCLEQTLARINEIYQGEITPFSEINFDKWMNSLSEPLKYLEAAKRVYLSKSMRGKLQSYKTVISDFSSVLEQECTNCLINYKHYVSSKLEHFPNVPQPMLITFSMDKFADTKTKIAIINKSNLSLRDNFSRVDFVENNDIENYRYIPVTLSEKIRETWDEISCGCVDISAVNDPEVRLSCSLLNYIEENVTNEKDVLTKLIDETQSADLLLKITDLLKCMLKELVKTIDRITT